MTAGGTSVTIASHMGVASARLLPLGVLLLVLVLAACGGSRRSREPVSGGHCAGTSALYIVAHQDDDLLFMNPDLVRDIQSGMDVRTVYLTAGDGGHEAAYWKEREVGIQAAYARMAGVEDAWRSGSEKVGPKHLQVRSLRGKARVSVVFLRLPDGNLRGQGFESTGHTGLRQLWAGEAEHLTSVEGTNSYSRAELLEVLTALMNRAAADCVGTLDASGMYDGDHVDHRHAAKFAFEAHRAYARPHVFSQYRGYNIRGERQNLSAEERDVKWDVFSTYAAHDEHLCRFGGTDCLPQSFYAQWAWRQYGETSLHELGSLLGGLGERCLGTHGGASEEGTAVELRDCEAEAPRWTLWSTGQVRGPGERCLEVPPENTAVGAPVRLGACEDGPRQHWTLLGGGQLRGPEGSCLEVLEARDGAPVRLGECADVPGQKWSLRFSPARAWGAPPVAQAGRGETPELGYGFRLADVNGDGLADACVRQAAGLACALNTGAGAFGDFHLMLPGFPHARPQFADLDGDGREDVCARGPTGLVCATANADGSAFTPLSPWSEDFVDAPGLEEGPGLFVLADLDGDGLADVCARSAEGIRCALNDGAGHFAPAHVWLAPDAAELLGGPWPDSAGRPLLLGDLDHDGRADLCGRSAQGLSCALTNASATGFEQLRLWSFRDEFSDAEGDNGEVCDSGSLHLADINGDGLADACGRRSGGLVCALSVGSRFLPMQRVQPQGFTDGQGWGALVRGASLRWGALDRDGHTDVCGWSASGPVCALAP